MAFPLHSHATASTFPSQAMIEMPPIPATSPPSGRIKLMFTITYSINGPNGFRSSPSLPNP